MEVQPFKINQMSLAERDLKYNWHAYTQHKTASLPIAITKAKGVRLWDENGKEYIDAIASWWVNPYGHSNTYIADAIYKQLTSLEHVLFGGFTHEPAVKLSEELMKILPKNQQKVFYSDNGSTAVEVAIKASLQFFYNQGVKKTKIIALEGAFHGDTFGAMAPSGISLFTEAFQGAMIPVDRIPFPTEENKNEVLSQLENLLKTEEYAAFIFEPLVQGASGMRMYSPEILDQMIALCQSYNTLTIADEVMTGFGKTGKRFACDYLTQEPDMMCLSKALTGGTIPLSITTFTQEIFDGFYDDDVDKALFHGHTFMANPTGCAAALACLELLESYKIQDNIQQINRLHLAFQKRIENHPRVSATRVLGVIFALDLKTEGKSAYYGELRNKLYDFFIQKGLVLRPVGNTIYILPPYIINEGELDIIYDAIEEALDTF